MSLVIIGSEGGIGRRLRRAFPDAIGVDRAPGADIEIDLATADVTAGPLGAALSEAEAAIYLATPADPEAPEAAHFAALQTCTRFVSACALLGVPRLVLPSSGWAAPAPPMQINAYGHSKRVIEALAEMYSCHPTRRAVALRFGWVPADDADVAGAADWLQAVHWPQARLVAEVSRALGRAPT
ncbi:NAD(P)-dependent oxidoreductase [Pseudoroseicyclus tamaricis]|uniref:NAD(P)-dependent oxidoreductase n=1 Tax=Pseudoroseicyclus tamaricis TaxID=2705421 RepID=A0A6B2JTK5_9RHOB|nr:NAD(P)-dependent oxidoreductase [Pseudoroseicyclus tamaricis]NDV01608.1 NAD(P)-dependent oxidoreductase [Pseudoroseicyclus tamaricis]